LSQPSFDPSPPGPVQPAERLDQVLTVLDEIDRVQQQTADLIRQSRLGEAMKLLDACFKAWGEVRTCLQQCAAALGTDLDTLEVDGRPAAEVFAALGEQLKSVRDALTSKDYVSLADVLGYEMADSVRDWRAVVRQLRAQA